MPENVNTSALSIGDSESIKADDSHQTMIKVDHVSMIFNMASEQLNSLKEYAIKIARRELFFEGFTALNDISFEVKKGDVFGIIGTNGSGKSTLLKIIAGVLEPTKGSCAINGNIAPLIELGAGFDTELSARENIYLNGALLGYSKKFINDHFDEIVEFAEIEKFLDMPLKNYSSGMVARIAFAIATVIVPEILVVDEVLSVGDFMFQKKCEDRINELIERHGVTVLIVSHSNAQIERMCNKVIWIEKGHTRMAGDAATVCRVYGGLGGRTGSPEAEQRVFEALRNTDGKGPQQKDFTSIDGDSLYGTAVRAAVRGWGEEPVDMVTLVCDTTHVNAIAACGFAGANNAPMLPVRSNHLPEIIEQYLFSKRPATILLLDKDRNSENVLEQVSSLPWKPEVIYLPKRPGSLNLSIELLQLGIQRNLWGDTALIAAFEDNTKAFCAAPLSYGIRAPFFIFTGEEKDRASDLSRMLVDEGIHSIFAVGSIASHPLCASLSKQGIAIKTLADENNEETVLSIAQAVLDSCTKRNACTPAEVCIGSQTLSQWPELLSIIGYAGKKNAAMLLEDPTNLESVSSCMIFMERNRKTIGGISFFGGESVLGSTDRELLYHAWKPQKS